MTILDLAKGKTVELKTDLNTVAYLKIKEIRVENKSRDLEPSTIENDFWPASENWTEYVVEFENGATKTYRNLLDIKLKEL